MDSVVYDTHGAYDAQDDLNGNGQVFAAPTARALATEAVHAGREDLAALGLHAAPIDLSTTYPSYDSRGRPPGSTPSRPTVPSPRARLSTPASGIRPSPASRPPSRASKAPRARSPSRAAWPR